MYLPQRVRGTVDDALHSAEWAWNALRRTYVRPRSNASYLPARTRTQPYAKCKRGDVRLGEQADVRSHAGTRAHAHTHDRHTRTHKHTQSSNGKRDQAGTARTPSETHEPAVSLFMATHTVTTAPIASAFTKPGALRSSHRDSQVPLHKRWPGWHCEHRRPAYPRSHAKFSAHIP